MNAVVYGNITPGKYWDITTLISKNRTAESFAHWQSIRSNNMNIVMLKIINQGASKCGDDGPRGVVDAGWYGIKLGTSGMEFR